MNERRPGIQKDSSETSRWITDLLNILRQAIFDPSWHPTIRLALLAAIGTALMVVSRRLL